MTSNLQFAGMEAPTCVFITRNIVEEIGARSGLLRATSRLVVVSYTKDVDRLEVEKRFVVHDRKPLAAEVDDAAKEGDIAGIKQLQQMDTSGKLSCHQHYIIISIIKFHQQLQSCLSRHTIAFGVEEHIWRR